MSDGQWCFLQFTGHCAINSHGHSCERFLYPHSIVWGRCKMTLLLCILGVHVQGSKRYFMMSMRDSFEVEVIGDDRLT